MLTFDKSFFKKLIIYFFISLTCFNSIASDDEFDCILRYIDEPPFWIVTGDKSVNGHEYDNLKGEEVKNYKQASRNNKFTISKRSIVLKDPDRPNILHSTNNQELIPIIVASVPDDHRKQKTDIAKSLNRYKSLSAKVRPTTNKRAIVGTRGYMFGGILKKSNNKSIRVNPSLMPAGTIKESVIDGSVKSDYIFIVKKDTYIAKINGIEKFDQSYFLKLKVSEGKYLVNYCTNSNDKADVVIQYFFDVNKLKKDGTIKRVSFMQIDPRNKCSDNLINSIIPIQENLYKPLMSISKADTNFDLGVENVLLLDGLKLSQIPQGELKKIGDQCYTQGPYGSFHYIGSRIGNCNGKNATREQNSDSLLKPAAACAMMGALKKIKERCPNCSVQWGDSFWPKGRHQTHDSGVCMDFRPLKPKGALGANNLTWGRRNYDKKATKLLIEEMMNAGASLIRFNDYSLYKSIPTNITQTTSYLRDSKTKSTIIKGVKKRVPVKLHNRLHSNHLHICFSKDQRSLEELYTAKNTIESKKKLRLIDKKNIKKLETEIKRKNKMNRSCASNL